MTDTATVETLTAEVRALMVGSRQVTLSVARQLDWVDLDGLDVFGRVKLGGNHGQVVIGRARTGALALAEYDLMKYDPFVVAADLDGQQITRCARWTYKQGNSVWVAHFGDRRVAFQPGSWRDCGIEKHGDWMSKEECEHWQTNGLDDLIRLAIKRTDDWRDLNLRAAAAPLIVLAGLR